MVQAGIDETDEPRWKLRPEPGYRAISGIVGRDHTGGTVVTAAASYSPLVIAEVRLSTDTASLVRVLPKCGSMKSPLHWQGGLAPVVRTAHTIADLVRRSSMADKTVGVPVRALYAIPEAMVLLSLSRTQIYELIRSDRLLTVTPGRRRLVPAEAISAYVALLLSEAGSGRDRAA
jgi:excisionase family DNA binding protein